MGWGAAGGGARGTAPPAPRPPQAPSPRARMGLTRSVASAHRGPSHPYTPVALRAIFMAPRRAPGSPCLPLLDKKLRNWASWDALWGIWA